MKTLPALTLAALTALTGPALAQGAHCGPRDVVIGQLDTSYGEKLVGGGLQDPDAVLELWISPESGSWTILMSRPDGTSCIVAAGTDWTGTGAGAVLAGVRS